MSLDELPFNLFDVILVGVLIAGFMVGRKRGMSGELIGMLRWLCILFFCALAYEPIGSFFGETTRLFSRLTCYLVAYLGAAIIVVLLFIGVHRSFGGKLLGSDAFGGAEYYLGMGSGVVRFFSILMVGLALLNARHYTAREVRAEEAQQKDLYGSHFFPTLHSVQVAVFQKSLTGPWLQQNLSFLFIKPTDVNDTALHQKDAQWQ